MDFVGFLKLVDCTRLKGRNRYLTNNCKNQECRKKEIFHKFIQNVQCD